VYELYTLVQALKTKLFLFPEQIKEYKEIHVLFSFWKPAPGLHVIAVHVQYFP
jgi:hypothetical protein